MNVLFDNCTSPIMSSTLNGFIQHEGHRAIHIRDLPLEHPKDVEWIDYIASTDQQWLVITGDQRIRKNKAEALAFRRAKLRAVILSAAYQKTSLSRCCAVLVDQWPRLFDTIQRFDPPFMLELSINFRGNFRQLSV